MKKLLPICFVAAVPFVGCVIQSGPPPAEPDPAATAEPAPAATPAATTAEPAATKPPKKMGVPKLGGGEEETEETKQ